MQARKQYRSYRKPKITTATIKPKESVTCKRFVINFYQMQLWGQLKPDLVLVHIANENISSPAYRMHLKAMGLMAGVPDYMILYNSGVAFIEFKRDKSCKLSSAQEKFFCILKSLNIKCLVAYSVEEAITFCENL